MKKLVASLVQKLAYASGFSLSRAKGMKVARVVMFHGVGDDEYPVSSFEDHLDLFAKHFAVVSLETLVGRMQSREALTNEIVLTFDDGLRNNFTSVYPILERLKLPATFFVCPGLIESGRWLWNHEVRARLQGMSTGERQQLHSRIKASCGTGTEDIVNWMKAMPSGQRAEVEEIIRNETPAFCPSPKQRQRYDMMSWKELRTLNPALITIGSHTVNHPILSTLEREPLRYEIAESRRLLEEKLHRSVDQFCYPNGSHNPAVVEEVRKVYRIAVTTEPGFLNGAEDLVQLPRIGIVPQPLLNWRLHRATA